MGGSCLINWPLLYVPFWFSTNITSTWKFLMYPKLISSCLQKRLKANWLASDKVVTPVSKQSKTYELVYMFIASQNLQSSSGYKVCLSSVTYLNFRKMVLACRPETEVTTCNYCWPIWGELNIAEYSGMSLFSPGHLLSLKQRSCHYLLNWN